MNNPKKVLFLIPSLSGGGAERAILDVITHVDPHQMEAKIGLMSVEGDYAIPDHFLLKPQKKTYLKKPSQEKYASVLEGLVYLYRTVGLVQDYLTHFTPDVVMTITESMNILSQFYRKLFPSKQTTWILRVGNNSFRELQDAFPNPYLQRLMRKIYANAYQNAPHILAISEGVKSMLIHRFGVVPSHITVIHNPVNHAHISQLAQEPIGVEDPFLVSIGRLSDHQKRIDILIEAYHTSEAHRRGIPLFLLGKFKPSDPAYIRIHALGLENLIQFKGFQKNPYRWMARALAVVHTAEWEGFCSVVAESLACGTHVISTDCDFGPREILTPTCGHLIPVNDVRAIRDAIDSVVQKQATYANTSEQAIQRTRAFDVRHIANRYAQLIKTVYTLAD